MAEGPDELTRPKRAGKVFFFARSPEAPRTTMTVFTLSSTELVMVLLATDGVARDSWLVAKGSAKLAQLVGLDKGGGSCLPRPFALVTMNHCVRHLECFPISLSEKE
jgi:hypothetical protein